LIGSPPPSCVAAGPADNVDGACEQDLSHELPDAPLPDAVAMGVEPLLIIGAIAGG
jgi:hypothetical protein